MTPHLHAPGLSKRGISPLNPTQPRDELGPEALWSGAGLCRQTGEGPVALPLTGCETGPSVNAPRQAPPQRRAGDLLPPGEG